MPNNIDDKNVKGSGSNARPKLIWKYVGPDCKLVLPDNATIDPAQLSQKEISDLIQKHLCIREYFASEEATA